MGKGVKNRQPLIITQIRYSPGKDGRDMEKLRRVLQILLAPKEKSAKKEENHLEEEDP